MTVSEEKIEEIRNKLRENIKKSDMYIEEEPQHSGDPKHIFDKDSDNEDNGDVEGNQDEK